MAEIQLLNPEDLHHPVGPYSQVGKVTGSQWVLLAGQTAIDKHGNVVGAGDFEAQCRQVFTNVETGLRAAGANWSNVVRFTNYLTSQENLPQFVKFREQVFPRWFPNGYPPNTLLFIERLLRKEFLLEIEAVAVL